jgi:MoaA/NifB/PqqE/SkfB family radical SAM enzyme
LREAIKLKEKYKNKKDDVSVGIGFTLSNLTADYLKDVMNYARGLNLKFLIQLYEEFSFYHNISREDENLIENYTTSDNRRLIEEIEKLPPAFHHEILLYALRHRLKYRCDALRTFFVLRANADVAPCLCYYQEKIGNLKMQSPCEIFNSKEARLAQRLVKNCKGCSNGWATDWSYEEWAPYFWKIIFSLYLKKFLNKFKKNKCQSY